MKVTGSYTEDEPLVLCFHQDRTHIPCSLLASNALNTTFGIGGIHQTLVSCSWKESWLNAHCLVNKQQQARKQSSKFNSKEEENTEERHKCIRLKIRIKLLENPPQGTKEKAKQYHTTRNERRTKPNNKYVNNINSDE